MFLRLALFSFFFPFLFFFLLFSLFVVTSIFALVLTTWPPRWFQDIHLCMSDGLYPFPSPTTTTSLLLVSNQIVPLHQHTMQIYEANAARPCSEAAVQHTVLCQSVFVLALLAAGEKEEKNVKNTNSDRERETRRKRKAEQKNSQGILA